MDQAVTLFDWFLKNSRNKTKNKHSEIVWVCLYQCMHVFVCCLHVSVCV